jgi:acetyl esterase/lipase
MGKTPNPCRPLQANGFADRLRSAGVKATVIDASDRNHGEINQWFGKLNDEKVTAKAWEFLQAIAETKSN